MEDKYNEKIMILLLMFMLLLTGCGSSGVSQEEYNKVATERDKLKTQLDALNAQESNAFADNQITQQEENTKSENVPKLSETELNSQIGIKEYTYTSSVGTAWYIMEVTNNSPATVSIEVNAIAKDANGKIVGAASSSENAIESGYRVCLANMFNDCKPENYEYALTVKEDDKRKPIMSDLSHEESNTGKKVIVSCTNNGEDAAKFVEGTILFFKGEELVKHSTTYFVDDDSELKSGNTIVREFDAYSSSDYDNYKIYFTGRK